MIRKHLSLLKEHPQGLWWLMFAEFWDRFCFYGIQAMLVLFLTKQLGMSDVLAYAIYGSFTALTFGVTILGGIAADRLLGFRKAIVAGALLMIVGNLLLLTLSIHTLFIGLALIIAGTGLFKPNNASLVGALYHDLDSRRDSGFSLFYIAMNAGGILGPVSYGLLSIWFGWSACFGATALGMGIALFIIFIKKRKLLEHQSNRKINLHKSIWLGIKIEVYLFILLGLLIAAFIILLRRSDLFNHVIDMVGIITFISILWLAFRSESTERKHILGLLTLSVIAIAFFACSLQTATTLTLFIEREVNRQILGINVPTMAFLSLEPLFIIILAPFVAKLWDYLNQKSWNPSSPMKMSFGIFAAALSFICFALASGCRQENTCHALLWVIVGNIPLGLGELLIFPAALSAIATYAPLRLRGTMMGVYFLSLAFGGFFAGLIASFISMSHPTTYTSNQLFDYTQAFIEIAKVTAVIGLIVFILSFWIQRFFLTRNIPN